MVAEWLKVVWLMSNRKSKAKQKVKTLSFDNNDNGKWTGRWAKTRCWWWCLLSVEEHIHHGSLSSPCLVSSSSNNWQPPVSSIQSMTKTIKISLPLQLLYNTNRYSTPPEEEQEGHIVNCVLLQESTTQSRKADEFCGNINLHLLYLFLFACLSSL